MATKKILFQNVPNGYSLDVDGNGYMYYNEVEALAGFLIHFGLGTTKEMERGSIISLLFSSMLGQAYTDSVDTLKQRIGALTSKCDVTMDDMDRSIKYVNEAQKQIEGMRKEIDGLRYQLSASLKEMKDIKEKSDTAIKHVDELTEKSKTLDDKMTNILAVAEAVEKSKKGKKKADKPEKEGKADDSKAKDKKPATKAEKATVKPSKPTKKDKPAKKDDDEMPKAKRGRNRAADEQVMKELKRQMEDNPNIK